MSKTIGIFHFQVGRTDGVSLEIDKWKRILEEMGHTVHLCAGDLGHRGRRDADRGNVPPPPGAERLYHNTFVALDDYDGEAAYRAELYELADVHRGEVPRVHRREGHRLHHPAECVVRRRQSLGRDRDDARDARSAAYRRWPTTTTSTGSAPTASPSPARPPSRWPTSTCRRATHWRATWSSTAWASSRCADAQGHRSPPWCPTSSTSTRPRGPTTTTTVTSARALASRTTTC